MSFAEIPPESITILPTRQRQDLGDLSDLKASISELGILNPLIVDDEKVLIAGERRLTCAKQLGLISVPVRLFSELDELTQHRIELEENIARKQLTWKEEVNAVAEYHEICKRQNAEWSDADTARALGSSTSHISKQLLVKASLEIPIVRDAEKFSVAYNAASRAKERSQVQGKKEIGSKLDTFLAPPKTRTEDSRFLDHDDDEPHDSSAFAPSVPIVNGDFLEWLELPEKAKFNFIHCDFPYGINTGSKSGQSAAKHSGTYDDSPETYSKLLSNFIARTDEFVEESAHLIFWFSMNFYQPTLLKLREAWRVNPMPLVWGKSDNRGVLPDPNRSPRQIYETAFFASRGDRKIVRSVANTYWGPTTREIHTSEKPRPMLEHFFRMVVDESTIMLDPTCGSGNSVICASNLGASVLGLELDPNFALSAQENFRKHAL